MTIIRLCDSLEFLTSENNEKLDRNKTRDATIAVISAGPMEVRGPLRPHTLQLPKAIPEQRVG